MKTYAAYYNDIVRKESSSGGLFSLIALNYDVIYGVEMDEKNQYAVFSRKTGDISTLRGSKYIQAKIGDSYKQVKEDLLENRRVLFTGTACQVNGLISFLQKDYVNLLTVDVICHGVPSPKYWQKFIEGKEIKHINFRAKDGGWDNYTYGMRLNDSYIPYNENKFMALYIKDYALRPACYKCVSKSNKKSDITIGDFWGIEKLYPDMTDNMGTSIVITRTDKGKKIFDELKKKLIWKEVSYEDAVKQNTSEYKSSLKPERRKDFFTDMEKMSFSDLYEKYYCNFKKNNRILEKIKFFLKKLAGMYYDK